MQPPPDGVHHTQSHEWGRPPAVLPHSNRTVPMQYTQISYHPEPVPPDEKYHSYVMPPGRRLSLPTAAELPYGGGMPQIKREDGDAPYGEWPSAAVQHHHALDRQALSAESGLAAAFAYVIVAWLRNANG
ncbi:hypothetical protein FA95DRAFT_1558757 [Auriscalpium vulgare]|uniref:Uncharacterized protein n=1 Tax=Auriscalpium vulgare TaxID=40419 RepID=A0ACB8RVE8_9AGAM|nr:hypothetical protein FA95DRAFT_1558757 [Auriscalpium vulgare]